MELFEPLPPLGYLEPVQVSATLRFASISASGQHTCGITTAGDAYCWGSDRGGALGHAAADVMCIKELNERCTSAPQRVAGVPALRSIVAGSRSAPVTCGLDLDGAAWCWGSGAVGQLGTGAAAASPVPVKVAGDLRFSTIQTGSLAVCALESTGALHCWGSRDRGVFGDGNSAGTSLLPVRVNDTLGLVTFAMHEDHVCGLDADGRAYCWGINWSGQLGSGLSGQAGGALINARPLRVAGTQRFDALVVGSAFSCGRSGDGQVMCWGAIGAVSTWNTGNPEPVPVAAPEPIVALQSSALHVCGLASSGNVYCWGANYWGLLGDGTEIARPTPVRTKLREAASALGAGASCAIGASGIAYCWGPNDVGQVGRRPLK